jgi:hypothetical protein
MTKPTAIELMTHAMTGRHGQFTGQRYRRGQHRCLICGAPNNAGNKLGIIEKITQTLMGRNPLMARLSR